MAASVNILKNKFFNPQVICRRNIIRKWKFDDPAIECYGFKYFPRSPDFKDPPYEPSKLFRVRRLGPIKGTTKFERAILAKLNIDGDHKSFGHISIVKNIPEINLQLYKVKHLIEILPINFINGLPEEGDYNGCYLRDNGDFMVSHKLKITKEQEDGVAQYQSNKSMLDNKTLNKFLRNKWDNPLAGGLKYN